MHALNAQWWIQFPKLPSGKVGDNKEHKYMNRDDQEYKIYQFAKNKFTKIQSSEMKNKTNNSD